MGIVNVTPDSFYDGGKYEDAGNAAAHAEFLLASGADVLDLGAESTRPGARPVAPRTEWERLEPALEAVRHTAANVVISIDTRHALAAAKALEAGAAIINDVSACQHDPGLVDVLAQYKPGYVLMHSQGDPANMQAAPRYSNVVAEIKYFFEKKLNELTANGVPENRIILDPGIGFGKTLEHNLEIMRRFSEFKSFGRPLMAAISMKSFLGQLLDLPLHDREQQTAVASALLFAKGASWHRVHNPRPCVMSLLLACAMKDL